MHHRSAGSEVGTPGDHRIDDELGEIEPPCRHAGPDNAQAEANKRERGAGRPCAMKQGRQMMQGANASIPGQSQRIEKNKTRYSFRDDL